MYNRETPEIKEDKQMAEVGEAVCPTCGQALPSDFGDSESKKRARAIWQDVVDVFSRKHD